MAHTSHLPLSPNPQGEVEKDRVGERPLPCPFDSRTPTLFDRTGARIRIPLFTLLQNCEKFPFVA